MKDIYGALIKAQSEMSNPTKGAANPFFKSKYADLNSVREAILPVLNNNGIAVLQPHINIEGKNFVKTIFIHESGESIESLTEIIASKQNDPQAFGSAVSYARRYGLQSFACVGAEDDDAEGAMNRGEKKPVQTKTPKEQPQPESEAQALVLDALRQKYRKGLNHEKVKDSEKKNGLLKINTLSEEQLKEEINKLGEIINERLKAK